MFAITADQVDSTHREDLVDLAIGGLQHRYGRALALGFERTAGDELQGVTPDAATALAIVLELTRTGDWSVGCGVGALKEPLPDSVRSASGRALVLARKGVDAAKKRRYRFALFADRADIDPAPAIDLLLALRSRRDPEGWQIYDLLESRLTYAEAAQRLGFSAAAVRERAFAAGIRSEEDSIPTLVQLLAAADAR